MYTHLHTSIDRQTDRQTDRQIGRQICRWVDHAYLKSLSALGILSVGLWQSRTMS